MIKSLYHAGIGREVRQNVLVKNLLVVFHNTYHVRIYDLMESSQRSHGTRNDQTSK